MLMMVPLAFLSPSFGELILIAIIALLLYGSDLPTVAKTWGKAYQDLRRHLSGMQRELNDVIYSDDDAPRRLQYYPEFRDTTPVVADAATDVGHSPAADAALAEGEVAQIAAADRAAENGAADGATARQDAHGAA